MPYLSSTHNWWVYLFLALWYCLSILPTQLMQQVMQSPPSVCPSICFHSIFGIDWPLTLNFSMWVGHDHSSHEIEGQGNRLTSRSLVRLMQSVRPRSRAVYLVRLIIFLEWNKDRSRRLNFTPLIPALCLALALLLFLRSPRKVRAVRLVRTQTGQTRAQIHRRS